MTRIFSRVPSIHQKAFSEQEHLLPNYQDKLGPGYKKKKIKEFSDACTKKKERVSNEQIKNQPKITIKNRLPIACNSQDSDLNTKQKYQLLPLIDHEYLHIEHIKIAKMKLETYLLVISIFRNSCDLKQL